MAWERRHTTSDAAHPPACTGNPAKAQSRKEFDMSKWIPTLLTVLITGVSFAASAQQTTEHTQHHPAAASATTPSTASPQQVMPQGGMTMGMSSMPQMQQHMQQHMATMQALHAKMAASKTPAERQALMAEHMNAMHEGMDMMKGMKAMDTMPGMGAPSAAPADPAKRQQMMEMRMDMMQTMMDMMMQRMPAAATPTAGS